MMSDGHDEAGFQPLRLLKPDDRLPTDRLIAGAADRKPTLPTAPNAGTAPGRAACAKGAEAGNSPRGRINVHPGGVDNAAFALPCHRAGPG